MHIPTPSEIRAKREMLDLTQSELARKAGVSQSMIARIEAGSVDPRVGTLDKIIKVDRKRNEVSRLQLCGDIFTGSLVHERRR